MEKEKQLLKERIIDLEKEIDFLRKQHVEINIAKELYLKIFEDFPALIWRSRLDKLCDYFNKTWLEFTGRSMEQEFGNGWTEGVHPDDFDFCLKTYVTAFDKRESFLMDYRMKNRFGEYRWIRDFGRPFYDVDNSFLGYIGSCYDVTEIKNNEKRLVELNATKDKFFSIIAHDLKSPFNSILGFSDLLMEKVGNKEYDDITTCAKMISLSAHKAMDLLTNLLQWSQLQYGKILYNPGSFDLCSSIDRVTQLFAGIAEQKSIEIVNQIGSFLPVFADKEMVDLVLRNLLSNSLKFTHPNGKISIMADIGEKEITISVTDNGVGISHDRIDKLFNIQEVITTPGTQNEQGTGLGLGLCKEFIERNHGTIGVDSKNGEGSRFYFTLPRSAEDIINK